MHSFPLFSPPNPYLLLRLCSYPDDDQLQTVYSTYLSPVLHHSLASHPVWGATGRVHALTNSMVQVYQQVSVPHDRYMCVSCSNETRSLLYGSNTTYMYVTMR